MSIAVRMYLQTWQMKMSLCLSWSLCAIAFEEFCYNCPDDWRLKKEIETVWQPYFFISLQFFRFLDATKYIIQVWTNGSDSIIGGLLKQRYRLIMSNYDAWYLDCGYGAWLYSGVGPENNWCSPFKGKFHGSPFNESMINSHQQCRLENRLQEQHEAHGGCAGPGLAHVREVDFGRRGHHVERAIRWVQRRGQVMAERMCFCRTTLVRPPRDNVEGGGTKNSRTKTKNCNWTRLACWCHSAWVLQATRWQMLHAAKVRSHDVRGWCGAFRWSWFSEARSYSFQRRLELQYLYSQVDADFPFSRFYSCQTEILSNNSEQYDEVSVLISQFHFYSIIKWWLWLR